MKKLLALILCVMLFVSVIPTSAFAYTATVGRDVNENIGSNIGKKSVLDDGDLQPTYMSKTTARRTVENLGKDINAMYTALAADQTVFGTAKTIYDMTDSLSKDLLKDIGSFTYYDAAGVKHEIYEEDLASNTRKTLNLLIGNTITNYMNERVGLFTSEQAVYERNADGTYKLDAAGNKVVKEYVHLVKPEKYIEVWGNAVKNALSSEKAQKNIEAMVTGLFALKVQKSVNDGADDLYTDIVDWDHWGEFNWGTILNPDTKNSGAYRNWNPVPDENGNYSALIATAGNNVLGWGRVLDADGKWVANSTGTTYQNATNSAKDAYLYGPSGNAAFAFAAGTGFYVDDSFHLPNS